METLSRDSLYLKQRLNLNIDVQFVRQGGKEGHTTADRWAVDGDDPQTFVKGNVKVKSKVKLKLRTVKLNVKVKVNVKENLKLKDKATTSDR